MKNMWSSAGCEGTLQFHHTNKHTALSVCVVHDSRAEEIKSAHQTVSLTSHPAEHTGGVLLCPRPAEINEIAA